KSRGNGPACRVDPAAPAPFTTRIRANPGEERCSRNATEIAESFVPSPRVCWYSLHARLGGMKFAPLGSFSSLGRPMQRILIVDDAPASREAMAKWLQKEGYETTTARN